MANEFLNREIFDTLYEARFSLERWVLQYNPIQPHSALNTSHRHRKLFSEQDKKGAKLKKTHCVLHQFGTAIAT